MKKQKKRRVCLYDFRKWGKKKSVEKEKLSKLPPHCSSASRKAASNSYFHYILKKNRIDVQLDKSRRKHLIKEIRLKECNKEVGRIVLDVSHF